MSHEDEFPMPFATAFAAADEALNNSGVLDVTATATTSGMGMLPEIAFEVPSPAAAQQCPIPMLLTCPVCGERHIDEGEFATKVHHTHACQHCGTVWRPALVATVGVQFLPGFKNGGFQ